MALASVSIDSPVIVVTTDSLIQRNVDRTPVNRIVSYAVNTLDIKRNITYQHQTKLD